MELWCHAARGATTVAANTPEAILAATRELLEQLVAANNIPPASIASVIFTATPDLNAAFPAVAARELGWTDTALLCAQEIPVPDSLPRCIRVLLHWNSPGQPHQVRHVYLGEARSLRPERAFTTAFAPPEALAAHA
ncbi:MAG TPA: chorismate mutase [Roseiflexaceae bacterium]|nr:chorismate mutase [Roseiflexaceae bacterium]